MADMDKDFYTRANAYIHLANAQCDGTVGVNKVTSSFTYGLARFSAWANATNFESGSEMRAARAQTIEGLVAQYRSMLEHHLDDHIENYDRLMIPTP